MQNGCADLHLAITKLLEKTLSSKKTKKKHALGERGPHFPCIMGHHRQYTLVAILTYFLERPDPFEQAPALTEWHRLNSKAVEEFTSSPIIEKIRSEDMPAV